MNRGKPRRHQIIKRGVLYVGTMHIGPAIVLARLDAVHLVVGNIIAQVVAAIIHAKQRPRPRLPVKAHRIAQARGKYFRRGAFLETENCRPATDAPRCRHCSLSQSRDRGNRQGRA